MSKNVIWMAGFDHLPVYPAGTNVAWDGMMSRLSLLPHWVKTGSSGGGIGESVCQGITRKGIQYTMNSFSLARPLLPTDPQYAGRRVHIGLRVSASDSMANTLMAFIYDNKTQTSYWGGIKTPAGGGAFDFYIEIFYDVGIFKAWLFNNGILSGVLANVDAKVGCQLYFGSQVGVYDQGVKTGSGFVYSDFIMEVEDSSDNDPLAYSTVQVKSSSPKMFEGDENYFNTIDSPITTGLSTYFDEKYQEVGGYLHTPATLGTLEYAAPDNDMSSRVVAVQIQSLVSGNTPGNELSQQIYSAGEILPASEFEDYTDSSSLISHCTVYTPEEPIAMAQAVAMQVQIRAKKVN